MDTSEKLGKKTRSSPRAAASIVFAICALFLWRTYGHLNWVVSQNVYGVDHYGHQFTMARNELGLACIGLAGFAVLWCLWSWLTESKIAAAVATIFALLALIAVAWMQSYVAP